MDGPVSELIAEAEHDLALPPGFLASLLDEGSDWVFVLKVHSLIEVALAHLLAQAVGRGKTVKEFSHLPTHSKIAFCRAMELVDVDTLAFLESLSTLRNFFAHDIRRVNVTLAGYVAGMNNGGQKRFSMAIARPLVSDHGAITEEQALAGARVAARTLIWECATLVVMASFNKKQTFAFERRLAAWHAFADLADLRPEPETGE